MTEEFIALNTAGESIRIGFTGQKISGRAGLSTFCGFLHWHRFGTLLGKVLPRRDGKIRPGCGGRPPLSSQDVAMGFIAGILGGAQGLAHVAILRADPMLRQLLAVAGIAFCVGTWLSLLESQNLRYIVVARLLNPVKNLCRKETIWQKTEVAGTEVAEKKRAGGKVLIDVPGYTFQALVTNLPESVAPIAVWRDDNGRSGCEGVIKQLDMDFALDKLCLKNFFATEAAMSLAVVAYNLCVLFQRHLGWMDRLHPALPPPHHRRRHQQSRRPHHHPPGRPARATRLVAKTLREALERFSQLQCNTLLPALRGAGMKPSHDKMRRF